MWSILSSIISGIIGPITNTITAIYTKKEDVSLEKFKVDGKVDIALVQAHVLIIQAQASLLDNRLARGIQGTFAGIYAFWVGKCVIWDICLGWGTTPALKGDLSTYGLWIMGFYFLHSAITSWGRKT